MSTHECARGSGSWTSGAIRVAVVAAVLGCVLLAGCASVHSAQEKVGGWVEGLGSEAPEPSPPPASATAKKAKKPVVSAAPAATGPEATPESVADETPVEDGSADAVDPAGEPQESESSIFDPY